MDLRIFGGFLISFCQIFLSCDFWFGESCDFQAWLFVFWVAFSVWGLNLCGLRLFCVAACFERVGFLG